MKIRSFLAILLTAPFLLAACNTVEGVGEDMSEAGDAIAEAAK
jgi:predicted small secreted protein